MAGNEQAFCNALDIAAAAGEKNEPYIYFEIGIGNGDTMQAAAYWMDQRGYPYFIIGVDLPEYSGTVRNLGWHTVTQMGDKPHAWEPMNVAYVGSQEFLHKIFMPANFIFIDGCHGRPCATHDFLLAEKKIKNGGVICFHDTDPNCQGIHFQPHCNMHIDVRGALEDLGLLNNQRPGWKKLFETDGDKSRSGHGAAFFQFTKAS